MCGLVALWSKKNKPVGQQVFNLYEKQAARGKQGYGFIAIDRNGMVVGEHRSKTELEIKKLLNKEKAPMVMFHHRFPTSTDNTMGTTHPMNVSHEELEFDYRLAHNGIIRNADARKTAHESLGYVYTTEHYEEHEAVYNDGTREYVGGKGLKFNDSESLAIDIARHLDGKQDDVPSIGPVAFWAVRLVKGTNQVVSIYYGKNAGRDLTTVKGKNYMGIASEHGEDIDEMKIFSYEFGDHQLYEQEFPIEASRPVAISPYVNAALNAVMTPYERETMRRNFAALEHRAYSYSEVIASGVNINAFSSMLVDGFMEYIPRKFAHYDQRNRLDMQPAIKKPFGFSVNVDDDEESDDLKKARIRLEELATQYAQLQTKINSADDGYSRGFLTEELCDTRISTLEMEKSALEDSMSLLGIDQEEVEAMVDTCLELEDYKDTLLTHNK